VAQCPDLVLAHQDFLETEVARCFDLCFDPTISLVRTDRHFGSIKDSTLRLSSTYDNTMLALLSRDLDALGLRNPFAGYDIPAAMVQRLWNAAEGFWFDDIAQRSVVTGENNTFPYWTRVFQDPAMIDASIRSVRRALLDDPFPLKYSSEAFGREMAWRKWTVPDYQSHSIKTHMGGLFIQVVAGRDRSLAIDYVRRYAHLVERHGTYLENYNSDGEPLLTRFYSSDEGNLWCANLLTLMDDLKL
jgi:hypothetical protein